MSSGNPVRGVLAESADSSEGKVEDTGVCSCASLGLVVEPMATPDRNEGWRDARHRGRATTEESVRRGKYRDGELKKYYTAEEGRGTIIGVM